MIMGGYISILLKTYEFCTAITDWNFSKGKKFWRRLCIGLSINVCYYM